MDMSLLPPPRSTDFTSSLPPSKAHQLQREHYRDQRLANSMARRSKTSGTGMGSSGGEGGVTRLSLPPVDDSQTSHFRPRWRIMDCYFRLPKANAQLTWSFEL